jgi:Leucine-rich repeat (LRR) protein
VELPPVQAATATGVGGVITVEPPPVVTDYPEATSAYRNVGGAGSSTKNKEWFFFEHVALLPEYILSFEYFVDDAKPTSEPQSLRNDVARLGPIGGKDSFSEQEFLDYTPFLPPLLSAAQQLEAAKQKGGVVDGDYAEDVVERLERLRGDLPKRPMVYPPSFASDVGSPDGVNDNGKSTGRAKDVKTSNGKVLGAGMGNGGEWANCKSDRIGADGNENANSTEGIDSSSTSVFASTSLSSAINPKRDPKPPFSLPSLLSFCGAINAATDIINVNLHRQHLSMVDALAFCTSLESAILSCNDLRSFCCLSSLPHLKHIDVSFNLIKQLVDSEEQPLPSRPQQLSWFDALQSLDLSFNLLATTGDLKPLKRMGINGTLRALDLRGNSVCDSVNSHRRHLVRLLPNKVGSNANYLDEGKVRERIGSIVLELDGRAVDASEREALERATRSGRLTLQHVVVAARAGNVTMVAENKNGGGRGGRGHGESEELMSPPLLPIENDTWNFSGGNVDGLVGNENRNTATTTTKTRLSATQAVWLSRVDSLTVNGEQLAHLEPLIGGMPRLTRANFAHNELENIAEFGNCCELEDLCLEDNQIVSLDGLRCAAARRLKRLDVSSFVDTPRHEQFTLHSFIK